MLTPLKITTEYSLLKSLIKVPDLINFLNKNNIKACGICDDELFGVMEFYLECKKSDIKPIIGLDIVINDAHIYLYAKNYDGYLKLIKLNTNKKDLEYSDLEDKNIIIVLPYTNIDLYTEFKNKSNLYMAYTKLSEKQNALLTSENIIYMPTIRALSEKDSLYLKYLKDLGGTFTLKDDEYYQDKKLENEDLKSIDNFVNLFDLEIPFNRRYIPVYNPSVDSYTYLHKLAQEGLKRRLNGDITKDYLDRLNMELDTIKSMGFVDYFLIVYDYVLYAKKHDCLVGPGRGSACGSLVSYAVGITDIDPIKYDLLFARFLNPSRKKMPDIDIDFDNEKREEIINYVQSKYGKDKVALGITFSSLKSKMVLREMGKILKIDNFLLEKFLHNINASLSLEENKKLPTIEKYLNLYPELKKLYDVSSHLENLKRNISTHAAGVVICSESLDNIIPVYNDDNILKTGYPMEYLEMHGILKMDFLGVRNLTIIKEIIKKIKGFNLKDIPLDDIDTFKLFQNGQTSDIFQFESTYAKNNLIKLKVKDFNELSIAVALVRPGPSNQIDAYIANKEVIPDSLKEILAPTRGIIIYQEQVMKIFEIIGGFTSFEADDVRIAMSKKKEKIILEFKDKFIKQSMQRGYEKTFAEELFEKMLKFAEYGFNKSHSVAYALISYQMAYLKMHYPAEFMSVMLKYAKSSASKKEYLNDLKIKGIKLLKPNINVSGKDFEYKNNYLLLPFNMIKGFNETLQNEVIQRRENGFNNIYDFFSKCYDVINESTYKMFALSGCLDTFKETKKTLIENYDVLLNYAQMNDDTVAKPLLVKKEEYTSDELMKFEDEYYGFYIGNHPCSIYKDVVKVKDINKFLFKNIKMALMVEKMTSITTKKGDKMAFVLASDETGSIELTLFPEVFSKNSDLEKNNIIFVDAKCSKRFDKNSIIVNNIRRK